MIIGITGTLGSGKGEKVRGTFARGCKKIFLTAFAQREIKVFISLVRSIVSRYFRFYEKVSYNLNSVRRTPAPVFYLPSVLTITGV